MSVRCSSSTVGLSPVGSVLPESSSASDSTLSLCVESVGGNE